MNGTATGCAEQGEEDYYKPSQKCVPFDRVAGAKLVLSFVEGLRANGF
jgi:hypothetical protein